MLVGDCNAHSSRWDDTNNRRGLNLARWACSMNLSTQRPPTPTISNHSGSSCVDLCFIRSRFPSVISTHPRRPFSDDLLVEASMKFGDTEAIHDILLAFFNNSKLCTDISALYNQSLPDLIATIGSSPNKCQF